MTRFPNRKQIATAIVKSGEVNKSFSAVLDGLKKMPINDCRWIVHLYPNVRAAMLDLYPNVQSQFCN